MATEQNKQSFWAHLDALRSVMLRSVAATAVAAIVMFCFKDALFAFVLAPRGDDFVTYRIIRRLALLTGEQMEAFQVPLISTGLAQQFVIHMRIALFAGLILASPYILYQLFRFVSPALYDNERHYVVRFVGIGYLMFILGVLTSYFLIFPLTFRFLGTYQVSADVDNLITLDSYITTLTMLCLSLGAVFEIPIISWLMGRLGILKAAHMRRYRRHAIIAILVAAAIITPTTDVFTLALVALPMWLLYEASILIVARTERAKERHN